MEEANSEKAPAFFRAAGDLVAELLADLQRDNPAAAGATAGTLKAGGFLILSAAFGTAGVVDTRLQLVAPDGAERTTLFSLEYETVQ